MGLVGMMYFFYLQGGPYTDSIPIAMVALGGPLILVAFGLPLVIARRIRHAIEFGVSEIGSVDSLQIVGDRNQNTYAGMSHGRIRVMITYNANGQQCHSQVFLDRPWVRLVKVGTQLNLLIDPNKPSILYVVGIPEQG